MEIVCTILLFIFCAGCSPSREEVYKNHPKYEIKTATNLPKGSLLVPTNDMRLVPLEEMPIPTKIGKPRNTPLELYEPKPLLYKGQLKKMWSKNNLKNKDYSGYGVTSDNFEDGWQIQNGSDSGLYDPATGKKIGARFEYYLLDEKNGVAFAEDRNLLYFQRYAVSVSLGLNEEYWRLPLEELDLWVSSKDSSVYYRGDLDSILLKVNAWTGVPDWELKRGRKGLFFGRYAFTNKYIFIDGDEWFEPTQYYLYRINPETLEIMKVDFKNFNTFF